MMISISNWRCVSFDASFISWTRRFISWTLHFISWTLRFISWTLRFISWTLRFISWSRWLITWSRWLITWSRCLDRGRNWLACWDPYVGWSRNFFCFISSFKSFILYRIRHDNLIDCRTYHVSVIFWVVFYIVSHREVMYFFCSFSYLCWYYSYSVPHSMLFLLS